MSRPAATSAIVERLAAARAAGRKLLVPYLTAGYPDRARCAEALSGLAEAGADAIELGVPFSDPLADGPIIAGASEAAIAGGTTIDDTLALGAEYAAGGEDRPPLVLFTYLNPVASLGPARLAEECRKAGFGAVLVADLPFDEDPELERTLGARGILVVRLAAPTTPPDRLASLARGAEGFVYLIARTGVTGAGAGTDQRVAEQVATIRAQTDVPVVVGFGIHEPGEARRVAEVADGIVIGSAFVERLGREGPGPAVAWMRSVRDALDGG